MEADDLFLELRALYAKKIFYFFSKNEDICLLTSSEICTRRSNNTQMNFQTPEVG